MMKILVVDSVPAAQAALVRDLKEVLGIETLAGSNEEVKGLFEMHKDAIGIIAIFLDQGPERGIALIREIQDSSCAAMFRRPRFLVLTPGNLTPAYESRLRAMGVECLVHGYPKQLHATMHRMLFEAKCEQGRATIIIERSGERPKFFFLGPARRERISCGPRLVEMMNYLAINFGTEVSTESLAEIAGITMSSVKVYLKRLRTRIELAGRKAGLEVSGDEVLCTFRKDGGYVHVFRARVLFV